jgi:ATP-dependent NAD(P)H-hydrate dehydratase
MNRRQKAMERCIVPLSASSYKGSSGRVGVLGGSARYTGAPYYAAMASLKVGADLAFCFCAEEAAIPLKSYSPELMVIPVYKASIFDEAVQNEEWLISIEDDDANNDYNKETEQLVKKMVEEVCSMMDKMHVLVIGPGLGRCPLVLEATAQIIRTAQSEFHLPLVIDADALFLLTLPKYRNNLLSNDSSVILTPNAMELKRIRESAGNNTDDNNNLPERCLIIEKGAVDIIRSANLALNTCSDDDTNNNAIHDDITCDEVGGLKRSGGIGDVLAGTIGTLVAWNNILTNRGKATYDDLPLSCWTACCFVKRATKVAFDRHRRSMTAPDILVELGSVIDYMTTAEDDNI